VDVDDHERVSSGWWEVMCLIGYGRLQSWRCDSRRTLAADRKARGLEDLRADFLPRYDLDDYTLYKTVVTISVDEWLW